MGYATRAGMITIIARKPRTVDSEYVIVERLGQRSPYVVGTVTAHSLRFDEWFWGHYFDTFSKSLAYFDSLTSTK